MKFELFSELYKTPTITSSNNSAARRITSRCPKVTGSKLPGYIALTICSLLYLSQENMPICLIFFILDDFKSKRFQIIKRCIQRCFHQDPGITVHKGGGRQQRKHLFLQFFIIRRIHKNTIKRRSAF